MKIGNFEDMTYQPLVPSTSKISKISLVCEQFSARIVLINAAVDKSSHSQVDKKNTLCNTSYKF